MRVDVNVTSSIRRGISAAMISSVGLQLGQRTSNEISSSVAEGQ